MQDILFSKLLGIDWGEKEGGGGRRGRLPEQGEDDSARTCPLFQCTKIRFVCLFVGWLVGSRPPLVPPKHPLLGYRPYCDAPTQMGQSLVPLHSTMQPSSIETLRSCLR
jgi:hypothetical protein